MKTKHMAVMLVAMLGGCFSRGDTESQMELGLTGGDFAGNSVRICGARLQAADSKYACDSVLEASNSTVEVPGLHAGEECPCFDFGTDGNLKDPTTHAEIKIEGLCPSVDFPQAAWRFDYTIYSSQSCHGTVLNPAGNDYNFKCFDSEDLQSQMYPNASVERLRVGANANNIICATRNSTKTWDFESCSIETTTADTQACQTRYDCGCELHNNACSCDGGLDATDLDQGCHFDHVTCDIVCANPTPPI